MSGHVPVMLREVLSLLQPKDGITREATPEHFHANRICTVNSEMKGGCP